MRRFITAVGAAVLVAASTSAMATPAAAAELGGFTLAARAPGIQVLADAADSPAPVHPAFDGTIPETFASLETGPVGHGLSSIFWPGPLFGNFGSVLVLAGGPPDSVQLNDPIRAETFAPQGPKDASFPLPAGLGSQMTSHADNDKVESIANLSQLTATGVAAAASITSRSISTVKDDVALAEGTSKITGLSFAAGAITIDSVTSTARITSDGTTAKGKGATTITGLKIAGQPATVDQNGLHIGPQGANPLGQINSALNTALEQLGVTAVLAAPIQEYKGAAGSFLSGALVFGFNQQGNYVTVSVGGVHAMVDASKGIDALLETPPPAPSEETPSTVATPPAADTGSTDTGSTDAAAAVSTDSSNGTSTSTGSGRSLASSTTPSSSSGFFDGLSAGILFLASLVAFAAAAGMRRLSSDVLSTKPAVCVLEREKQ